MVLPPLQLPADPKTGVPARRPTMSSAQLRREMAESRRGKYDSRERGQAKLPNLFFKSAEDEKRVVLS